METVTLENEPTQTPTAPAPPVDEDTLAAIVAEYDETEASELATSEDKRIVERYLRISNRKLDELERIKAFAAAQERRIKAELAGLDYVCLGNVREATRRLLAGQSKRKSIDTPYGTAGFRKVNASVSVVDETKVPSEFFEPRPPALVKSKVNEHFKTTGEVPAGCTLEPEHQKFYAK